MTCKKGPCPAQSNRKTRLDSGHNPQAVILNKTGTLQTGTGQQFRGLAFPCDLISFDAGTFDVVQDETELRAVIERIARVLGKDFDADAAIADAMRPAPVRVRDQYAEQWAAQALDVGFLIY